MESFQEKAESGQNSEPTHNSEQELLEPTVNSSNNEESDSLTISLTPPIMNVENNNQLSSDDDNSEISEHIITSNSSENDRSLNEIEVKNFSMILSNLPSSDRLSQEQKPLSLNSNTISFNNNSNSQSIISLNALELSFNNNIHMEGTNNVQSILEEILNNEQFNDKSNITESKESSINIFANIDLDDNLLNYNNSKNSLLSTDSTLNDKKMKDFEELIAIKDSTIAALTSELDSLKEMVSNPSSNSLGTSTDYKQYQEECQQKVVEYHTALVHKDEIIQKLTESLHQSILNREELKQQTDNLQLEIAQLHEKFQQTTIMIKEHKCDQNNSNNSSNNCDNMNEFNQECSKFAADLDLEQLKLFNNLRNLFNQKLELFKNENFKDHQILDIGKEEYEMEIARLRQLLSNIKCGSTELKELKQELDQNHSKEMEELRTYFEKKCADLEKNYSEEVFSQHSRKLSESSSSSDLELPSDFIFTSNHHQPGPDGDKKIDYTRKDLMKLNNELKNLSNLLNKNEQNLNEINDEDFNLLKLEIGKFDLKNLLKYDLCLIQNDLQNKYHAELEILREDFDNRIDLINLENEKKLNNLKLKYIQEIDLLNDQLHGIVKRESSINISSTVQEVESFNEFEINEVVQSYERRLQEQINLAKIDIINALQIQIQRLASNDNLDDDEWPIELLTLKEKFSEKYENEIKELKNKYERELKLLKLNRNVVVDDDVDDNVDNLKKQVKSLHHLLNELCKYFIQCENELNNTLIDELLKKAIIDDEEDENLIATNFDDSKNNDLIIENKRVRLTPNLINDIINNLIDNNENNYDESIDLKNELNLCLEKLKSDASEILLLSTNYNKPSNNDINLQQQQQELISLQKRLTIELKNKNDLNDELNINKNIIKTLENERINLEKQLEEFIHKHNIIEYDLKKAHEKIAELIENGHKEIISEGYGEDGQNQMNGINEAKIALIELQDKVRNLITNNTTIDQNLLQLIEELSRIAEKIIEEAKKERDDLEQQVEAADKKYKKTCQFLEEQAAEREQERDETQKIICKLKQLLKERDKDRESCERINSEVEQLEQQLRENYNRLIENEKNYNELELEKNEAIEKIHILRDVIRDLEKQIEIKNQTEIEQKNYIIELENIVKQLNNDLNQQLNSIKNCKELEEYINKLEIELKQLQLKNKLIDDENELISITNQLNDLELNLDKKIKNLETLNFIQSTTNCSSPSEDMSVKDIINLKNNELKTEENENGEIPLQQLSRLREKLLCHSRVEDVAIKRIRDLELELFNLKNDLNEFENERDLLKKQLSDQLILISSLQIRLDNQRLRAENIEKETKKQLEIKIYDLQNQLTNNNELLYKRDKNIKQLNNLIDELKERLKLQEIELQNQNNNDDQIIINLQKNLDHLNLENQELKLKIDNNNSQLINNIILEKNTELKEKLSETEKQLQQFLNLNLSQLEFDALIKLRSNCNKSFIDLIDDLNNKSEQIRRISVNESLLPPTDLIVVDNKNFDETNLNEISEIKPIKYNITRQTIVDNSNNIKRVHFEDIDKKQERIEELELKLNELQMKLGNVELELKTSTELFEKETLELKNNEKLLEEELNNNKVKLNEINENHKINSEELNKNYEIEINKLKELNENKLKEQEDLLLDRKYEIEILNEDAKTYQNDLLKNEEEINDLKKLKDANEKEIEKLKQQILELNQELIHLNDLMNEKEKIIQQITEDSKSLKSNLEIIQNKIQESGNIIDLNKRLRNEQKLNHNLLEEMNQLKSQLLNTNNNKNEEIDEITGQLQNELNLSFNLDNNLINAVNDDFDKIKNDLIKEKLLNKELNEKIQYEKLNSNKIQLEAKHLIEQLRLNLDDKLDENLKLENELIELKKQFDNTSSNQENLVKNVKEFDIMISKYNKLVHEMSKKNLEVRKLNDKIDVFNDNELVLNNNLKKLEKELNEKNQQIDYMRNLMDEVDQDRYNIKKCFDELNEKLKRGNEKDVTKNFDKVITKIKELSNLVQDNRKMLDMIERLRNENKSLEKENHKLKNNELMNLPFNDPTSRANYLFAKFLRSESYRKSLQYQKKYLIKLLETYQQQQEPIILLLENKKNKQRRNELITGKRRFKSVVSVIVSLIRMKFLVKRWNSGKRFAEEVNLRYNNNNNNRKKSPSPEPSTSKTNLNSKPHFRVGQPISNEYFGKPSTQQLQVPTINGNNYLVQEISSNKSSNRNNNKDPSWTGISPPSKETRKKSTKNKSLKAVSEQPLTSPNMLQKYMDRINQIQDKLGIVPDSSPI